MKMRRISSYGAALAIGALLGTFGATNARANDVDNDIVIMGGTNFFGALHTDNIDFTDTFTFTIGGAVSANVSLITIGNGANNIDFLSADLNGVMLTLTPNGFLESGFLGDTDFTGPLVLTVRGSSDAAGGTFASYSGTMNVIPEPSVALLMGLGLGGLGYSARGVRSRS
jgi:hypothetical protein